MVQGKEIGGSGRGGGCFIYGCLIAIIIALTVAGLVVFFMYRSIRGAVETYTSGAPTPVPTYVAEPSVTQGANAKYRRLIATFSDSTASADISFSGAEINSILYSSFPSGALENVVAFEVKDDQLSARFSIKVGDLKKGWPALAYFSEGFDDRYVNGLARGSVAIVNGKPAIKFSSLNLNGSELPDMALGQANDAVTDYIVGAATSRDHDGGSSLTKIVPRIRSLSVEGHELRISVVPGPPLAAASATVSPATVSNTPPAAPAVSH